MDDNAELLERFRIGADVIADSLSGARDEEVNFRPEPDKWTVREIVCHLADTEATAAVRLRQVISEDNPTIVPWKQDAWAKCTDYAARPLARALNTLRVLREDNYELLKLVPASAWSKTGNHLERGKTTVADFVQVFVRHIDSHALQIQKARVAWNSRQ